MVALRVAAPRKPIDRRRRSLARFSASPESARSICALACGSVKRSDATSSITACTRPPSVIKVSRCRCVVPPLFGSATSSVSTRKMRPLAPTRPVISTSVPTSALSSAVGESSASGPNGRSRNNSASGALPGRLTAPTAPASSNTVRLLRMSSTWSSRTERSMLAPPVTVPVWVNWASPELDNTTRDSGSSAASAAPISTSTSAAGNSAPRSTKIDAVMVILPAVVVARSPARSLLQIAAIFLAALAPMRERTRRQRSPP